MRKVREEVRRRVIGKEERGGAEEERGEEQRSKRGGGGFRLGGVDEGGEGTSSTRCRLYWFTP